MFMSRRLLLVHAHPDDESIGTGVTIARYVSEGAEVTLVTCTLGEEGEILLPDLVHLAADAQDQLGEHRQIELANAMAQLGVSDHRLLGGPGAFRDSGMIGTPSNERTDCFWRTDLLVAATELVSVIREVRPQVAVTYDDFGGYGHPDHIQAHRVLHYAIDLAESPTFRPDLGAPWRVSKIYWTAFPRSVMKAGIEALQEQGSESPFAAMDPDEIPFACDDALVTTVIDAQEFLPAKMAALAAHATQVSVDDGFFALSNNLGTKAFGIEYFRIARGVAVVDDSYAAGPLGNVETDLFAGVDE
jgi:N-acetyl-1-D-myo-inositol-2-amino-2-deoxy-alpha-D-glucopyranoside deacetylase